MSKERIRWYQVERYFKSRGYHILPSGLNKVILEPKKEGEKKLRNAVVIPEKMCDVRSAEVEAPILKQLKRVFNVTPEQILKG